MKILLTGVFFALYLSVSLLLLNSPRVRGEGQHENDLYFQADSEFFVKRVAKDRHTYDRIRFHPLFVIFFNPIGSSLNELTNNPEVSASILNALPGALCVLSALILFYDVLMFSLWKSVIYSIILGLTATQLIFSAVVDTFIFSSLGFILLMFVALGKQRLWAWIGITVFVSGVTISNAVPALLAAYFFYIKENGSSVFNRKRACYYLLGVSAVAGILSIAQKLIYNVWIFSDWKKIKQEDIDWYLFVPNSFPEAWERVALLMKHIWLFSIVPPDLQVTVHFLNPSIRMATFMETPWWGFSPAAMPAALLWITILLLTTYYFIRGKLYREAVFQFLMLVLCFNLVLHFFYGDDFMLFSGNWLIFLLLLIILTLESTSFPKVYPLVYKSGLLVFCFALAVAAVDLVLNLYSALLIQ